MMLDEIDELIELVLELYKKKHVDGDTWEVSVLAEKLMMFAVRYSLESEMCKLREKHLPIRSNQKMTVEDANAIIQHLLSLRSRFKKVAFDGRAVMHPVVLRVAEPRMEAGQYADAVESAFKELNNAVKEKVRTKFDKELDGQKLMQRVFAQDNPILFVKDNLDTQTKKDTQQGYMMMFSGAMSAIRNPKAHQNMTISRDDAIRKLMFASMLMYKLDVSRLAVDQR